MLNSNRLYSVSLLVICAMFLPGCWPFSSTETSSKPELVIINVLDKADFDDCHIAGSINITFDEFEAKIPTLNKNNHYVIYCADYMCMSSGFCAKLLKDAKFEHVWAYEGGMAEWHQKGYPCAGPAQAEYLTSENMDMSDEDDEAKDGAIISAEELLAKIEQFASAE